jgi:hypothetical protein
MPVNVQIECDIKVSLAGLPTAVAMELEDAHTYKDPMYLIRRRQNLPTGDLSPYIRTWRRERDCLRFWRGSLGNIVRTLKRNGIDHELIDNRLWLPKLEMPCSIELRDYQRVPVARMIKRQQTVGRGEAGCHPAGTRVVMADGTLRAVEEVKVGDLLLGPDGRTRRVLKLHTPTGDTWEVCPVKGPKFEVNDQHVLTVYRSDRRKRIEDVALPEYLNENRTSQKNSKLVRSGPVDFPMAAVELPIDPYFLGVLLGDECLTKGGIEVCAVEGPIVYECECQAESWGLKLALYRSDDRAPSWGLSGRRGEPNLLLNALRDLDLAGRDSHSKFIPHDYKVASIQERRQLLAGLIDTDGHLSSGVFDYVTASCDMARDLQFVCRSLGLFASLGKKWVDGFLYCRLCISGDLSDIPCRIPRKRAGRRKQRKSVRHTGFTVRRIASGARHFGFTLTGNGRYLLDDFTVTHNSGKTEMLLAAAAHFRQPTLVLVWQERQQRTWLKRVPKYFQFEAGGVGGAFKEPVLDRPIVIGMIQSVRNRLDTMQYQYGCVICDEVDRFAAPTLREVVNKLPAAVRLGASDDERRRDGREFLLYDTFGPRSWKLAKGTGQCDVEIFVVPTNSKYRYASGDWTELVDHLIDDEIRNEMILRLAFREVREKHRVLIWSDRVEHCELLKSELVARGVKAGLLIGGQDRKEEADRTEDGLRDGTIEVGVGTSVAEKSVNVPPLDRGIMTCASADRKGYRFRQMRGRLARPFPGKRARIYYLWDKRIYQLRSKVHNITRRYRVKTVVHPFAHKEGLRMGTKAAVTLDTLKAGCKALDIDVPKGATPKKLEKLIQRELARDKTFGAFTCGACFRDIVEGTLVCPYCGARFKPVADDDEEPETEEEQEIEEEEEEEGEEEAEEESEKEEEEEEEEGEEEEAEEEEEEEESEEEAEEEGEEEEEEEEEEAEEEGEEEEEEPKPKKKSSTKKKRPKSKSAKAAKEADNEAKRAQLKEELPYSEKQLKAMKRRVLIMIAAILGIKNALKLGSTDALIAAIIKIQRKKFPDFYSKKAKKDKSEKKVKKGKKKSKK